MKYIYYCKRHPNLLFCSIALMLLHLLVSHFNGKAKRQQINNEYNDMVMMMGDEQ